MYQKYINEKLSAQQIADECNISRHAIRYQLEKNGMIMRTREEGTFYRIDIEMRNNISRGQKLRQQDPKEVKYVGNRAWWRYLPNGHNKNPDFKITGQNKVIELFGDYFHRKGTPYDNPQELIDLYKQVGLDCLIFWEHEVYNSQEEVLKRVSNFIVT